MNWFKSVCISILLMAVACNHLPQIGGGSANNIYGFYVLNQGNEGNNSTLDYYEYSTGIYSKDIFTERNPYVNVTLDGGCNDMAISGARLYVTMPRSNLIEIIDVRTGWHVDQIPVPNCRYFAVQDRNIYVSSYGSATGEDPGSRLGYIAKIDSSSFEVMDTCIVGYQPEEMAVVGSSLYVANSGINRAPDYDYSISVVDLHIFREAQKIEVAPNLHRMEPDNYGNIWVSSRGDYYDIPSMTFVITTEDNSVKDCLVSLPCIDMAVCGDSLYVIGDTWNYFFQIHDFNYSIVDVRTHEVLTSNFIAYGADAQIQNPSAIAVNPQTREILIADSGDGVTPGKLYCFSKEGILQWSVRTGVNPVRIVFTRTPLL